MPLIGSDDKVIGVLSLHAKHNPPFTPQERDIGLILMAASAETREKLLERAKAHMAKASAS